MKLTKLISAGLCSVFCIAASVLFVQTSPAQSQTVRVMQGAAQAPLRVPLNQAVVLESDEIFAELSVANPQIADIATLSERTIYVLGKAPGRTTVTLLDPAGRLIANIQVHVITDIAEIKERIADLMPSENIQIHTANDGIVLSGVVSSAQQLQRALEIANRFAPDAVLNQMVVGGTQQVMLKVRFAEMNRAVSKSLGVDVEATSSSTNSATAFATNNIADGGNAGALSVALTSGSTQLSLTLAALENKGLVRTLAEPNLTALSGQSASFLAGGEYPIPVLGENGQVSADYRPFGIELDFTPTVVDGEIINLQLRSSVSNVDTSQSIQIGSGATANAFTNRRASTTVELRDGQSFAIGGLLEDDFNDSVSQVPWLGDIPVLGALFRSSSFQRNQSELVIIITAHLVNPTSGEALALPTDRIRPPTEGELFLFGEVGVPNSGPTSAAARNERELSEQDFTGSYGYVLE